MKTDAIREALNEFRHLLYSGIYEGGADDAWKDTQSDAVAELSAIEKENTMLRETLVAINNNANLVDELSDYSDLPDGWAEKADSALTLISNIADV